jgi:hypothetical protein
MLHMVEVGGCSAAVPTPLLLRLTLNAAATAVWMLSRLNSGEVVGAAQERCWKVGELTLLPTGLIQPLLPLDCRMHGVAET